MTSPSNYYAAQVELEAIKAMAFELLMSDECTLSGPLASRLADHVFDRTEGEAKEAIRLFLEEST